MRGQISLDLILAITIGFFAVGAVLVVNAQISEMQTEAGIRQQLNDIGNGLASIISNSAVLNEADFARIDFDVPFLLVPGEGTPQKCNIAIGEQCDGTAANAICLSYEIFDLETGTSTSIEVEKRYVDPPLMGMPNNVECGETLRIAK